MSSKMQFIREAVEDKIYDIQMDWIVEKFGRKAAAAANYGWGVSGGKHDIQVETKVYGHGVLTTRANYDALINGAEPQHSFAEFK